MIVDYRERVALAKRSRGAKMVVVRCPVPGCRKMSGAAFETDAGALYEATLPFTEAAADLRGEEFRKYPSMSSADLLENIDGMHSRFYAACSRHRVVVGAPP